MNVNSVAVVSVKQEAWKIIKKFTVDKSPMNVNIVVNVLAV